MPSSRPRARAPRRRTNAYAPEMRLVLALFDDAIRSAARNPDACKRRERHDCLDARAWMLNNDREWPFAFANVCDLLGLDADAVRQRVLLGALPGDDGLRLGGRNRPRVDLELGRRQPHERFTRQTKDGVRARRLRSSPAPP